MDPRHIDALERELTDLSAELEIGTHRQLEILRELEPTGFWAEQGASSFAHWLSWSIGLAPGRRESGSGSPARSRRRFWVRCPRSTRRSRARGSRTRRSAR